MIVLWSPHAETLLDDIVIGIAEALSVDDGLRWEGKLRTAAADIGEFPFSGPVVPAECFHTIPVMPTASGKSSSNRTASCTNLSVTRFTSSLSAIRECS